MRFLLTIHRQDDSFPGDDEDEGFSQITKQDDGSSLAEIHLVGKWDIHPGFDNNLINCVDVGVLQGHVANLYLQLWRPESPLPPFLASGYQTYFETYDIYKDRPTTTAISRSGFRNALQGTILKSNSLRPNLSEKINLTEEAYSKDSNLNGALASRFILTLLSDPGYQKAAFQLITPGTKPSPKTIAAMEKSWHGSLYKTLAASRPARPTDFTTKGKVPGAASVTRLPDEMGYAIGYCKDNSHGNKNSEYWVAGVGLDGSKVFNTRIFGEKNHKDVNSKGGPGGAGTARIVYNPKTKTIAFYLSHNMLWDDGVRHQGGFVGFLDTKGKRQGGGNTWFYSHNFDQRLILANGEFCALAHGDAYPRALGFSRWPGAGEKALANQPYHQIEGESGANVTNCQTGGLVALPSRKFAIVFASLNRRKAHDICVLILDENGKATKEKWLT